ncbi:hypothetical protein HDE_00483 [Halotydeus destructor]|nr:hypothetical protein HDE_00483 [Halotydeus destructor]
MACADILNTSANVDAILNQNLELDFSGLEFDQSKVSQENDKSTLKQTGTDVRQEKLNTPNIHDNLSDPESENERGMATGGIISRKTGGAAISSNDDSDSDSDASFSKQESERNLSDSEAEIEQSSRRKLGDSKEVVHDEPVSKRKRLENLSDSEPEEVRVDDAVANLTGTRMADPHQSTEKVAPACQVPPVEKLQQSASGRLGSVATKPKHYPMASTSKGGLESLFEAKMTEGTVHRIDDELAILHESKLARKRNGKDACSHPHCHFSAEELTRTRDDFLPCPKTGELGYTASEKLRREEIGRQFKQNFVRSQLHHLDKTKDPSTVKVVIVSDSEIDSLGEVYGAVEVAQKDWQGQTPCNIAPNIGSMEAASMKLLTDRNSGCASCKEHEVNLRKSRFAIEELEKELEAQVKQNENMHDNAKELEDLKQSFATREKSIEKLKTLLKRSRRSEATGELQKEPSKPPKKKQKTEPASRARFVDFKSKIFDNETWDGLPSILTNSGHLRDYPNERPPMLDALAINLAKYLPTDEEVKKTDEYFYVCYGCGFTCINSKWRNHTRRSAQCAGQWRGRRKNTTVWTLESEERLAKKCGKTNISNTTEGYIAETPSE